MPLPQEASGKVCVVALDGLTMTSLVHSTGHRASGTMSTRALAAVRWPRDKAPTD